MSAVTTAWVGTRKGLFRVDVDGGTPTLGAPAFLGSPVTNAVVDQRDGAVYASLDHGHFGVHLHGELHRAPGAPGPALSAHDRLG